MAACFFYNREASQVKADFLETARYLGYVKNAQPDEATAKLIEKCIFLIYNEFEYDTRRRRRWKLLQIIY